MSVLEIYTDGAYSPARKQGGVGIVFIKDGEMIDQYARMFPNTTNNQMEIAAVLIALKSILNIPRVKSVVIYTDSMYVIGCATKGWRRKTNRTLWTQYDQIKDVIDHRDISVEFKWVHGHNGNHYNELADDLAVTASQEIV